MYVRGRININILISKNWQKNIINCDYDEYHVDIIENQIIRYTIDKLLKLQFKDNETKRALEITKRYFNNITFKQITPRDITNIQYTVLNAHYKQIHSFCRMILELIGIYEREGLEQFNAYSLDMNMLFERYIGRILKEQLQEYDVVLQDKQYLDEEKGIDIKPDVVIYKEGIPLLVLDTKYKIDSSTSNNDIFQLYSYMNKLNVNGIILYPFYEINEMVHTLSKNKLFIKTFTLDDLENSVVEFVGWMKEMISLKESEFVIVD